MEEHWRAVLRSQEPLYRLSDPAWSSTQAVRGLKPACRAVASANSGPGRRRPIRGRALAFAVHRPDTLYPCSTDLREQICTNHVSCSRRLMRKAPTIPPPPSSTSTRRPASPPPTSRPSGRRSAAGSCASSPATGSSKRTRPTRCSPGSTPAASRSTPRFASPPTTGPTSSGCSATAPGRPSPWSGSNGTAPGPRARSSITCRGPRPTAALWSGSPRSSSSAGSPPCSRPLASTATATTGVLAPNSPLRPLVTASAGAKPGAPLPRSAARSPAREPIPPRRRVSSRWAALLARIYEAFPLSCARCGQTMRLVAFLPGCGGGGESRRRAY